MNDLIIPPNDQLERAEMLGTVLILYWRDGHRGELPLETIRDRCPCAGCGGKRSGRRGGSVLRMAGSSGLAEATEIRTVGRYALQFHWRDGHAEGIYSFELLRSICQCPECASG